MLDHDLEMKNQLVTAALNHVVFDGWGDETFSAACRDCNIDEPLAKLTFPRKGLDLAIWAHKMGDATMLERLKSADLGEMRFRDKIATAVRMRLECAPDVESVRRATTLFALPQNAAQGGQLIWGTCDAIWTALGDTSRDINYYTKRSTLSAVYSSTVLYWLGDTSDGNQDTWDFLDRRIDNVMQFEKFKSRVNANPLAKKIMDGPLAFLNKITAPAVDRHTKPGTWMLDKE